MQPLYAEPCVLVGGAPRSGTTLVGSILAAHPQAAVLLEDRLTAIVRSVENLASVRLAPDDGARTARFGRPVSFVAAPLGPDDLSALASFEGYRRCFGAILRSVFAAACERPNPQLIGSKLPIGDDWEDVDHLVEVLGGLRLIFVIRNPLDVIHSSLVRRDATRRGDDHWHVETVEAAHAEWSSAMRTIGRLAKAHGKQVRLVKYEDLCASPATQSARLFEFLGLEPLGEAEAFPVRALRAGLRLRAADTGEADYLDAHFDGVNAMWADGTAEALVEAFADEAIPASFGERISLADAAASRFLVEGFSSPEPWGSWTDAPLARIRLRHPAPKGDLTLALDLVMARRAPGHDGAPIRLRLNAGATRPALAVAPGTLAVTFPQAELRATGVADIEIEILAPKPRDEDPVADTRALGLAVAAMTVAWTR